MLEMVLVLALVLMPPGTLAEPVAEAEALRRASAAGDMADGDWTTPDPLHGDESSDSSESDGLAAIPGFAIWIWGARGLSGLRAAAAVAGARRGNAIIGVPIAW